MPHLTKSKNWLPTPHETASLFDGSWRASIGTQNITAIISRRKVYANAEFMADIRVVTERLCVMVLKHDDVRGELSADGRTITWSDGDEWHRSDGSEQKHADEPTVPANLVTAFDGAWEVMSPQGAVTLQIARKKILWHDDQQTSLAILSPTTCAMVLNGDTFEGELNQDKSAVQWSDGDVWTRKKELEVVPQENSTSPICVTTDVCSMAQAFENDLQMEDIDAWPTDVPTRPRFTSADAAEAVLKRNADRLQRVLESGVSVTSQVDPRELWRQMRWEPNWHLAMPETTLLPAAILLQWPEGVELCIRFGADVNSKYSGPFRCADGSVGQGLQGSPILRLGLSARDHYQSLICGYILSAKVQSKDFHDIKKKRKEEMTAVTEALFKNWVGPFCADAS